MTRSISNSELQHLLSRGRRDPDWDARRRALLERTRLAATVLHTQTSAAGPGVESEKSTADSYILPETRVVAYILHHPAHLPTSAESCQATQSLSFRVFTRCLASEVRKSHKESPLWQHVDLGHQAHLAHWNSHITATAATKTGSASLWLSYEHAYSIRQKATVKILANLTVGSINTLVSTGTLVSMGRKTS